MASEQYHKYLASREWGLKKRAIKERSGGICERCHNAPMENVHHLTYKRLYNEPLEDLQGLCRACHVFESGVTDSDPLEMYAPKVSVPTPVGQERLTLEESIRLNKVVVKLNSGVVEQHLSDLRAGKYGAPRWPFRYHGFWFEGTLHRFLPKSSEDGLWGCNAILKTLDSLVEIGSLESMINNYGKLMYRRRGAGE
jgi:hypothetical protein